jgi:hypothetical protein
MKQLAQLAHQVQQSPPSSESRAIALTQLVDFAMRTSPICRPRPGQFLEGIYLDIFQAAKRHLRGDIEQKLDRDAPPLISVRDWLFSSRERAFQKVLNKGVLEELAIKAQSHSSQKQEERWQALTELINALRLSGKLLSQGPYPPDVYADAVNRTLLFVAQNIDAYNPNKGEFMAWVNYRFSRVLKEVQSELEDPFVQSLNGLLIRKKYHLNALIQKVSQIRIFLWLKIGLKASLADRETYRQLTEILLLMGEIYQLRTRDKMRADSLLREMAGASLEPSIFYPVSSSSTATYEPVRVEDLPLLSEQVRDYITSDPEGLCQKHLRENPSATFQAITLAYLEGKSWKAIAESFNLGVSAVKNFFQRRLKEIAPAIKSYIQSELN